LIYTHSTKAPERCKHHNGRATEAERYASGAGNSGSEERADAIARRFPGKGTGYPAPSPQIRT